MGREHTTEDVIAELGMHLSAYLTRSYPQFIPVEEADGGHVTYFVGKMDLGEQGTCFFVPTFTSVPRAKLAPFLPQNYKLVALQDDSDMRFVLESILRYFVEENNGVADDLRVNVNSTDSGQHYPFRITDVLTSISLESNSPQEEEGGISDLYCF